MALVNDQSGGEQTLSGTDPAEVVRPEYVPEEFWDADGKAIKAQDVFGRLTELQAKAAAADAAREGVPEAVDGYELALPEDVKLPEGLTFEPKADDPLFQGVREWAHANGIKADAFKALVGLWAKDQADEIMTGKQARETRLAEEKKALGTNADQRIGAVDSFLKANLGADEYQAMRPVLGSAKALEAVEKLIARAKGPTLKTVTNDEKPNAPDLAGMSALDKLKLANAEAAKRRAAS